MRYQIRFIEGELQGKTFPIGANALSIGRSHSNEVRLTTPDVSSRHVNLSLGNDGVILENLSARVTKIDDDALTTGDRKRLVAGQVVTMGALVKFTLEALADAPKPTPKPVASDGDATVPPPAPSAADNDVTIPPSAPKKDEDATVPPPAPKKDADATVPPPAPKPKPVPKPIPKPVPVPTPPHTSPDASVIIT